MKIPKLNPEEQELLWKSICDYAYYQTLAVNLRYYPSNRVENRPVPIGMLDMWGREVRLFADIPYDPFTEIRLLLRPISSMTVEEYDEYSSYDCSTIYDDGKLISNGGGTDWLMSHYFDYRGLIEKGLALEAPEKIYKDRL